MQLSRFFHVLPVQENVSAVFNGLLLEPMFVSDHELANICSFDVAPDEISELKARGIYVLDRKVDGDALELLQKRYITKCRRVETLYLCVTDFCNLSCSYCYVRNSSDKDISRATMTIPTAAAAISKWRDHLLKHNIQKPSIVFYGGEPMLNWDVIKYVVDAVRAINLAIQIQLVTNGTLFSSDQIDYILSNDIDLGISIDGPAKYSDSCRVFAASSRSVGDVVEENIKTLVRKGCNLGLSIAVTNSVLEHRDEILVWIKNSGVKGIYFNILQSTNEVRYDEQYYHNANRFLQYAYEYLHPAVQDGNLKRKIDSFSNSLFKISNCSAIGINQLAITASGKICICQGCTGIESAYLGDVYSDSFDDVVSRDLADWINIAPIMKSSCHACPAIAICGGGCLMESVAVTGSASEVDWPHCIHSKSSLEWLIKQSYYFGGTIWKS